MASWLIDPAAGSARAARVRALVLDVDGVLTDGHVYLGDHGVPAQAFHVHDGLGLRLWHLAGHHTAVISGRMTNAVAQRCAHLGITHLYQGVAHKRSAWEAFLQAVHVPPEEVCVCGDDLLDLPLMQAAGLAVAVADAVPDVRAAAHLITERPGGHGAVRELVEFLLRAQGKWSRVTDDLIYGIIATEVNGSLQ
ncbi:MAG: HAD hydrolase family protein [bacterium]|nr:HAD hydrolase family protein [bacterium]